MSVRAREERKSVKHHNLQQQQQKILIAHFTKKYLNNQESHSARETSRCRVFIIRNEIIIDVTHIQIIQQKEKK